jgi:hypothetical protein
MRLAIVTSGLDFGSAETQTAALAVRLAQRGCRTTVVSLQHSLLQQQIATMPARAAERG